MKIALIHFTTYPEMGGVENMLRDQANMLVQTGHQVKVLSGSGADLKEGYQFVLVPQMAPDFPLNKSVRAVLDRGQFDQSFNQYRAQLLEAIDKELTGCDLTIVHDVFTTHTNLPLTRALHDLAGKHRMMAWTHNLTATNSDVALPNPTQSPWNLMRTPAKEVTYIAASDLRSAELKLTLKFPVAPQVIPDMLDPASLFGCSPNVRKALQALEIPWRDFVFLLPARVTMRKNIEFAVEVVRQIRESGRNPLLLITGGKVGDNPASDHYGQFLRQSIPPELERHVVFVSDFFPIPHEAMRDLYLLSDCLLYPSKAEGFGLPVIEAAMHRMPVWCFDVPSFRALEGTGSFLLKDIAKLPDAVNWLEGQTAFRQQRRCRRLFEPLIIYSKFYDSLLKTIPPRKS